MDRSPRMEIIGVGDDGLDGLTEGARKLLDRAEVLLGPAQLLDRVLAPRAERIELQGSLENLASAVHQVLEGGKPAVMLTGGDPLFYGVARYLCDRFGKDRFNVVPHVSSMQLAFARVKESWDEAYLANLDTVPLARVMERVRGAAKAGLFTTPEITPAVLAAELLAQQIDHFQAYVCENLGAPDERVTRSELPELTRLEFAPLNVVVLVRKPDVPDRPVAMEGLGIIGNLDELFLQSRPKRGLLTPMEVRVIALALLDLGPRSILWDVGAGSGSVAIEAARLATHGEVLAIEMDPEDHGLIVANAERFGVGNVTAILGQAPEAWRDLPRPDAIFVGGTGRAVATIVGEALACLRSRGRIVVNVASLENVTAVRDVIRRAGWDPRVRLVQISESVDQFESTRLETRNPSFLISACRPGEP